MPNVKGVVRRIVRDSVNAVLIDDLWNSGRSKPERIGRSMRRRRNIDVEVELGQVDLEATKPWEEMEMNPSDATQFRGIVARCNFL